MFRKMISYGGVLLLAGAVTLATPGSGWAQRGGHGGGGHFGGAHFGGARVGGAHFGGARVGGARFGGGRVGGFRSGYYGNGYRLGNTRGYAYPRYGYGSYGSYGYYPYLGSYGSYPDSYYAYPDYTYPGALAGTNYDAGYSGLYAGNVPSNADVYSFGTSPTTTYQANYPPATATSPPDAVAHLNVTVPADAQLWFDDTLMKTPGKVREFQSPPLAPGTPYNYQVRARWTENGHEVTQTQRIQIAAGAHVNVTFPVPAKPAARTSAQK